jgi:TonB family protein
LMGRHMPDCTIRSLVLGIAVTTMLAVAIEGHGETTQGDSVISVAGHTLIGTALHRVDLIYPEAAQGIRAAGPVIVQLIVEPTGRVASAAVLEAPHKAIGEAVTQGLSQWVFAPLRRADNVPARVRSTVIVYALVRQQKGTLLLPPAAGAFTIARSPAYNGAYPRASRRSFVTAPPRPNETLLDVTDKADVQMAGVAQTVSIPLSLLPTRAHLAFDSSDVIGLDCTTLPAQSCERAIEVLQRAGLPKVLVLDRP